MTARPPNILFIQTDQLTASALRAYGDTVCQSPHLDRLAEEGVVFDTAYCNYPLCAPSRFSMASGLLPSKIGAYDNGSEFPSSIPTYAHYLREQGYQTCLSGKMHFVGPDQLHGFEERLTTDIYPSDFSWSADWTDTGRSDPNDDRALRIAGPCRRSVQIDYDDDVCFKAVRKIYDIARSNDERPFFLQASFTHPHDPYLCLKEHWDRYDGLNVPAPEIGALPRDAHDAHSLRLLDLVGMLDKSYPDEWIANAKRAYYGSISYIDDRIGELLTALDDTGLSDNTVIVFTSDHGEMLGERGMWFKRTFFEKSLRVPLIIHAPGRYKPGRVETFSSLLDILPTLLSIASDGNWNDASDVLDGTDLTRFIGQEGVSEIRPVLAEYLSEMTLAPLFMIRRGRFKFITSSADPDLCFDLEEDPNELENIAERPDMERTVAIFRRLASETWDADEITKDVLLSQRRRRLIEDAMGQGARISWDYGEDPGDVVPWYRGQRGYNEWAFEHIPVDKE